MSDELVRARVFLHGLYAVFEYDDGLLFLIPNLGHEHVYKAGDLLSETVIPPKSTYDFSGPEKQTPEVTYSQLHDQNISFKGIHPVKADDYRVYAALAFPTPCKIYLLRPSTFRREDFSGSSAKELETKTYPDLQVLEYQVPKQNVGKLRLGEHPWNQDGKSTNLHIISDPESTMVAPNHGKYAFDTTMSLFTGIDLHWNGNDGGMGAVKMPGPGDINSFEISPIYKRIQAMANTGRALAESKDLSQVTLKDMWEPAVTPRQEAPGCTGGGMSYSVTGHYRYALSHVYR